MDATVSSVRVPFYRSSAQLVYCRRAAYIFQLKFGVVYIGSN